VHDAKHGGVKSPDASSAPHFNRPVFLLINSFHST
jgi:hypothetical protein